MIQELLHDTKQPVVWSCKIRHKSGDIEVSISQRHLYLILQYSPFRNQPWNCGREEAVALSWEEQRILQGVWDYHIWFWCQRQERNLLKSSQHISHSLAACMDTGLFQKECWNRDLSATKVWLRRISICPREAVEYLYIWNSIHLSFVLHLLRIVSSSPSPSPSHTKQRSRWT